MRIIVLKWDRSQFLYYLVGQCWFRYGNPNLVSYRAYNTIIFINTLTRLVLLHMSILYQLSVQITCFICFNSFCHLFYQLLVLLFDFIIIYANQTKAKLLQFTNKFPFLHLQQNSYIFSRTLTSLTELELFNRINRYKTKR